MFGSMKNSIIFDISNHNQINQNESNSNNHKRTYC